MTAPQPPHDWPSPSELETPPPSRPAYVGIAGFTRPEEVQAVAHDGPTIAPFGTPAFRYRRLAIGVLASWDTVNGRPPNRFPERYPDIGRVRGILEAAAEGVVAVRCLRIVHFNSRGPDLLSQLEHVTVAAGPALDGFQINIPWPPAYDLETFAKAHPRLRLIVQVNRPMIDSCKGDPIALTARLGQYHASMTDVLYDASGGNGLPLDVNAARAFLASFHGLFGERVGIGVAGGLDAARLRETAPLLRDWPDLSLDAEGRIRDADGRLGAAARAFALGAFDVIPSSL